MGNFLTGFVMLKMPFAQRILDIIAWPVWRFHQVFNQDRVLGMIQPTVEKHMNDYYNGTSPETLNAVSCTMDLLEQYPFEKNSKDSPARTLSHETLQLIWGGSQSPAVSVTSIVFKLLEEPKYIDLLREEIELAIKTQGWHDSLFQALPLMDSVIREVHRMHPTFSLNATRYVKGKPFTFSDVLTLPVGTRISFPAEAMQRDPEVVPDPDVFDGFRYVKPSKQDDGQADISSKRTTTSLSAPDLTFGYGNHTCPGRFIAMRLINIMLCRLLLDYDFGWDRKDGAPPRYVVEGSSIPNVSQKITVTQTSAQK